LNEADVLPARRSANGQNRAGDALRRLVDLASHHSGAVFAIMSDAAVTLPQVLLLHRVEEAGSASFSDLASDSNASAAALSQMIDRLVQQGLLRRAEDSLDRRRKAIAATPRARLFLRKLAAARSADYQLGLSPVSRELRSQLAEAIERAVAEIESAREPRRGAAKKKEEAR
jgi:DNA-binding MarR family transcriptional regulator